MILSDLPSSVRVSIAQPNWIVGPLSYCQESKDQEVKNFEIMVDVVYEVDTDSKDWEVIQCAHWSAGWVEFLAVRPDSAAAAAVAEVAGELEALCG